MNWSEALILSDPRQQIRIPDGHRLRPVEQTTRPRYSVDADLWYPRRLQIMADPRSVREESTANSNIPGKLEVTTGSELYTYCLTHDTHDTGSQF